MQTVARLADDDVLHHVLTFNPISDDICATLLNDLKYLMGQTKHCEESHRAAAQILRVIYCSNPTANEQDMKEYLQSMLQTLHSGDVFGISAEVVYESATMLLMVKPVTNAQYTTGGPKLIIGYKLAQEDRAARRVNKYTQQIGKECQPWIRILPGYWPDARYAELL